MSASEAVEKLRQIWTPEREVEEVALDIAPQTELDSQIRHILHALVQQSGQALKVDLSQVNRGTLRWERVGVKHEKTQTGDMLVIWVEE